MFPAACRRLTRPSGSDQSETNLESADDADDQRVEENPWEQFETGRNVQPSYNRNQRPNVQYDLYVDDPADSDDS